MSRDDLTEVEEHLLEVKAPQQVHQLALDRRLEVL
jgi:hypothetical protein